jgi:predicted nuclease of restriction endonuclease-like (RecB) superfamily
MAALRDGALRMTGDVATIDFLALVDAIQQVHEHCAAQAGKAVNISLTLRNWAIGCHIREYEQNGADRAEYGENLLDRLAERLDAEGMRRVGPRELRRFRQFYLAYARIWESLTPELKRLLPGGIQPSKEIRDSATPELTIPGKTLVTSLSFTHLNELMAIEDPLKRTFYEVESIRSSWSVRELKRQIGSLYFERSGLSKDKKKLASSVQGNAEFGNPSMAVRDPYVFEFLGLRSKEVMGESDLEDALLDKLQDFLLELGHGFCFEARQKRILIGESYNFVDLVFYHRVLKCHVLLELKVAEFSHEHLGQLNTYVSWFKRNQMTAGDNPPIGILLCTRKDHALVEYALADMDKRLFVSKYEVELPSREEMQRFIAAELAEAEYE